MKKRHREVEGSTFIQRISNRLELSPDIFTGVMVEIRGQTNMTVHGCVEILLYTPKEVRLLLKECILDICGERLYCTAYHTGVAEIDGLIESVRYERSEKKK